MAVHFDGACAVAVAEHAPVHLAAELAHFGAFVIALELAGLAVERFDFLGDGEVLIGDGLVRDAGVDHGHGEGFVAEQRSDGIEAHATVDRLGREGMAELMGGDVTDPGFVADAAQRVADP